MSHDARLIKLLDMINSSKDDIIIVPVEPDVNAKERMCFINVKIKTEVNGGKVVYGWRINDGDLILEAEFHAVWETPNGILIDITPHEKKLSEIKFVKDPNGREWTGYFINSVRINKTENTIVDDAFLLLDLYVKLRNKYISNKKFSLDFPPKIIKDADYIENNAKYLLECVSKGYNIGSICFCCNKLLYKDCLHKNIPNNIMSISKAYNLL